MKAKRKLLTESSLEKYLNSYTGDKVEKQLAGKGKRIIAITKQMVENTKKMMEDTSEQFIGTANLAGFTPVLIPLVVRMMPQLFSMNLVGVQPMTQDTGKVFALRYNYNGNSSNDVTDTYSNLTSPADSLIVVMDKDGDTATDPLANTPYAIANVGGDADTVEILPVHTEKKQSLWKIVSWNSKSLDEIKDALNAGTPAATITVGGTTYTVNAASYNNDVVTTNFKKYSGPRTTTDAETNYKKRSRISMQMTSQVFEAGVRELFTEFSIYAFEDALAAHQFNIQNELLSTASYLMSREIDGEIIDAIEDAATLAGVREFDFANVSGHTNEITKVQTLVIAINELAKEINKANRAGRPNFLVVGATAASLLESLPGSMFQGATVVSPTGEGFIGVLAGRYNVYLDQYRDDNTIIIGYKGQSEMDAGIVFAPYRPISAVNRTGEEDMRYKTMFYSRYTVVTNLYGAENYYRKLVLKNVDFLSAPAS